jgi:acetyl esterase/lipase
LLTHFDAGNPNAEDPIERLSSRPDLGILCYPVISMGPLGHAGSRKNLLGENPPEELIELLSNEKHVTKDTPPTFLFHTAEDAGVKVQNSLEFAAACAQNGVPFSLHVYPKGPHGIGLGTKQWDPKGRHPWTTQCSLWLQEQGFAK